MGDLESASCMLSRNWQCSTVLGSNIYFSFSNWRPMRVVVRRCPIVLEPTALASFEPFVSHKRAIIATFSSFFAGCAVNRSNSLAKNCIIKSPVLKRSPGRHFPQRRQFGLGVRKNKQFLFYRLLRAGPSIVGRCHEGFGKMEFYDASTSTMEWIYEVR